MTSAAGRDGKVEHRRREGRTQLHEAGVSALTTVQPQLAPDAAFQKAAKAKRRIITGIASGCVPA